MTEVKKTTPKKNKKSSSKQQSSSSHLVTALRKMFEQNPKKQYNSGIITRQLKLENNKDALHQALNQLIEKQIILHLAGNKYALNRNIKDKTTPQVNTTKQNTKNTPTNSFAATEYEGYVDMTRSGSAFIICNGLENDVFVPAAYVGDALHGDKVIVKLSPRRGKRLEGRIKKVKERATAHFMGTIKILRKYAVVVPHRENIPMDIRVEHADLAGAHEGDTVVVKVTQWATQGNMMPQGVITAVVNNINKSELAMQSILVDNGFPLAFEDEVMREANTLDTTIPDKEVARRRDFRSILTFTIDPEDAKDFDDAISYQKLENGDYEIGVHIADVTHYVQPDSALDKEAFRRSTSVYLVDRVLPMLPEKLSNELCSLRPNEDKFTFSAVFIFDSKSFQIKHEWFGKTIIHSAHRFSYEAAQEVLDARAGKFAEELQIINTIAKHLREKRFKHGAINFESDEVKFRLDENAVPVEVYVKERKDAHLLIEDFMLLANRAVATYIHRKSQQEIPFVYRIHDAPDMDKLVDFALFAKMMGFKVEIDTPKQIAESFNRLAKATETDDTLKLLEPLAIRTMSKAVYSTNNIGHYGLAFDFYSHFTSPIRRYSDVLAHRILEKNLAKNIFRTDKELLESKCKHVSNQERKAMEAERESIKYKQVEYVETRIGQAFDGVVSGIIEKGIFIELKESKSEGLIGFDAFQEPFDFEVPRLRVKGRHTGTIIKVGDIVRVRIKGADLAKRQIDMELIK